jgi:N-acetylmuramoyl-L-alanine amidase
MIFIFAGHGGTDVGAVGVDRRTEARETLKLRNAICLELKAKGVKYIIDDDNDKLRDVLKKAQTGSGSVVLDIHFNAASKATATGVETIVSDGANNITLSFAAELAEAVTIPTGLKMRGVKREKDTPRKRLALMRENGIVGLLEVCFISNKSDMALYDQHINKIAANLAGALIKYEQVY